MQTPASHIASTPSATPAHAGANRRKSTFALTIGALGVVYGDIGTSPLYALDIMFHGRRDAAVAPEQVIGGLSLVIWALTVVIALKYAVFVLRADNDGEG